MGSFFLFRFREEKQLVLDQFRFFRIFFRYPPAFAPEVLSPYLLGKLFFIVPVVGAFVICKQDAHIGAVIGDLVSPAAVFVRGMEHASGIFRFILFVVKIA